APRCRPGFNGSVGRGRPRRVLMGLHLLAHVLRGIDEAGAWRARGRPRLLHPLPLGPLLVRQGLFRNDGQFHHLRTLSAAGQEEPDGDGERGGGNDLENVLTFHSYVIALMVRGPAGGPSEETPPPTGAAPAERGPIPIVNPFRQRD